MGSATFVARTHHQLQAPPRPHPSTGHYPGPDARLFANGSTNHCPISGVPRTPRQGWPLTSAPRGGTPGSRPGSTAGALRSGSRCSWPVALNQMLGVKRGESQSSAPPQYGTTWGRDPARTQPHAAHLNLQASHQSLHCCLCPSSAARPVQRAGCWSQWIQAAGGETRVSSELHSKAGSQPGSWLSCPRYTASPTLVIFVSRLVSMGRLPLLMGTVFQPSSATRLPRPPGHKGDRHKAQSDLEQCPAGTTHPWEPWASPSPGTHCWRMAQGGLSSCPWT